MAGGVGPSRLMFERGVTGYNLWVKDLNTFYLENQKIFLSKNCVRFKIGVVR